MRVVVTRPKEDNEVLRRALSASGHDVILAPMMEIEFLAVPDHKGVLPQAIIFTSCNGVRALKASSINDQLIDRPVFAVGDATAQCAREAGFSQIHVGKGSALNLVDLIRQSMDPGGGPLVHYAGEQRAVDVEAELLAHGLPAKTLIAYRAIAKERLPSDIEQAARLQKIDAVTLMSARTAVIYVNAINRSGVQDLVRSLHYICISEAVGETLQPLGVSKIAIAETPTLNGIVGAVNRIEREADNRT